VVRRQTFPLSGCGRVARYSGRTPTPDRIFPIAMVVRVAHWRAKTECCQHIVNSRSILEYRSLKERIGRREEEAGSSVLSAPIQGAQLR